MTTRVRDKWNLEIALVACPYCEAAAGVWCKPRKGKGPLTSPHMQRLDLARGKR